MAIPVIKKRQGFNEESALALYLREISKHNALSSEEESELAVRIRDGDQSALDRLVRCNLRFVVSVSRNYQNQGLPLSDLINEGNLGLIRAAKRFDERKNFRFISYAVWWIRQAILQALAEQSRIVKLPLNRVGTIHKIGKTQSRLEQRLNRLPYADEIAEELAINSREVRDAIRIGTSHLSLDAPVHSSKDSHLMDTIEDHKTERPDDAMKGGALTREVDQILSELNEREREVVKLYYGIDTEIPHTLEEIGIRLDLTRERVRQLKEKALRRLKLSAKAADFQAFTY
jgi:RNA polymerase primary sigma factor